MRKENSEFLTAFVSEAGTSLHNRDYFAYTELDDLACYVIADGLDTDKEVYSAQLVVKSILKQFMDKPSMSPRRLRGWMQTAHRLLQTESTRVRLKAGIAVIVTNYSQVVWAVAGHCRIYLFRNRRLHARSEDQSLSWQLAREEAVAEDRLNRHEERHNLLHYAGQPGEFRPYISRKQRLSDGDVLMMCTPGMWENVDSPELMDAVAEAQDHISLADTMEELLLSKQQNKIPNYTICSIFVNKAFQEDPKKRAKLVKRLLLILIPLLLVGSGATYMTYRSIVKKAESIESMFEHARNAEVFVEDGDYPNAVKEFSEARNAAKRVKDRLHLELYDKKQRISQLIVTGDGSLKDGDYVQALTSYRKAQQEAKGDALFDAAMIERKIAQAESVQQVLDWMKEGDLRAEAQDYEAARQLYARARKAAIDASYSSGEKELKAKLEDAEQKLMAIERELKLIGGEKLEKQAELSDAEGDYAAAVQAYSAAQEIYQSVGMLEKVLATERKIAKAQEQLQAEQRARTEASKEEEARRLEAKGDGEYGTNQYASALATYKLAQKLYQELALLDDVLNVGEKLLKADEKLQEALAAADGGSGSGSGSASSSGAQGVDDTGRQ